MRAPMSYCKVEYHPEQPPARQWSMNSPDGERVHTNLRGVQFALRLEGLTARQVNEELDRIRTNPRQAVSYEPDTRQFVITGENGEQVRVARDDMLAVLALWLSPDEARRLLRYAKSGAPLIEQFIAEHCYRVDGHAIEFAEFYRRFLDWLPPESRPHWSKIRVSRSLPAKHASGKGPDNVSFCANLAWEPKPHGAPFIAVNGKLRRS